MAIWGQCGYLFSLVLFFFFFFLIHSILYCAIYPVRSLLILFSISGHIFTAYVLIGWLLVMVNYSINYNIYAIDKYIQHTVPFNVGMYLIHSVQMYRITDLWYIKITKAFAIQHCILCVRCTLCRIQ